MSAPADSSYYHFKSTPKEQGSSLFSLLTVNFDLFRYDIFIINYLLYIVLLLQLQAMRLKSSKQELHLLLLSLDKAVRGILQALGKKKIVQYMLVLSSKLDYEKSNFLIFRIIKYVLLVPKWAEMRVWLCLEVNRGLATPSVTLL